MNISDEKSRVNFRSLLPVNKRNIAFTIFGLVLVAILAICVIYPFYLVLAGSKKDITTISIDNGYSIRIWEENVGVLDDSWDPDIGFPLIYYEVKKSDVPIVSKRWLGLDFGYDYDIKFEFIPKGVFVCHQDTNHRHKIIEFIVGIEEGTSLPHLIAAKASFDPKIEQKWADSDGRLKIRPLTSSCLTHQEN